MRDTPEFRYSALEFKFDATHLCWHHKFTHELTHTLGAGRLL